MKYFYLGANIHREASALINASSDSVILYESDDIPPDMSADIAKLTHANRAYGIDAASMALAPSRPVGGLVDRREAVLAAVLNDFKVFLLKMRYQRIDLSGAFEGLAYFADIVDHALAIAEKAKPDLVFCSYTPHTVESWLVVRTLEEVGGRVIRLIPSPLPWVSLPVEGLKNGPSRNLLPAVRGTRNYALDRYFLILRGEYAQALPYYEKKARWKCLGDFVKNILEWRPQNVLKQIEKKLVYQEFLHTVRSRPFEKDRPYAVYFLHYQPEMNTLPEADIYCDQFQAIVKLSRSLPEGVQLLIKEHPSTFSKRCDRRWRPRNFYARMLTLNNTCLCPEAIGTFDVIDRSVFVASIAGVCLTEAMARGKVPVSFFTPRYALFAKDLVIDANILTVSELREVFAKIARGEWSISDQDLRGSFERMMSCGYDGALEETYIPQSIAQAAGNARRANCLAIQDILDGHL